MIMTWKFVLLWGDIDKSNYLLLNNFSLHKYNLVPLNWQELQGKYFSAEGTVASCRNQRFDLTIFVVSVNQM